MPMIVPAGLTLIVLFILLTNRRNMDTDLKVSGWILVALNTIALTFFWR